MKRRRINSRRFAFQILILTATFAGCAKPHLTYAQQITPADSASVLLDTAREFASEGQSEVATELYRYIIQQFPDTPAADSVRALLEDEPSIALSPGENSGSTELQVWSGLAGLVGGIAIPATFCSEESSLIGVGLLAGGPIGFFAGRRYSRSRNLSMGQARTITLGGTWGAINGLMWTSVADPSGCGWHAGMGLLGGAVGTIAGVMISGRPITDAQASAANYGGLFGAWVGLSIPMILDADDKVVVSSMMGVSDLGLLVGGLMAHNLDISSDGWSRVGLWTVLGATTGFGINLIMQVDNSQLGFGIPLATSLAGAYYGITRQTGRDEGPTSQQQSANTALLHLRDGDLSLGSATPFPVLHTVYRPGGASIESALGLSLFRAVF